jgi:hypothetical protein
MDRVNSCMHCAARPLVGEGALFVDGEGAWVTVVCAECRTCIDPDDRWFRVPERPTLRDWKEGEKTMLLESAQRGYSLNPFGRHTNEHLLCRDNRAALNEARDAQYDAHLREAFNVSLADVLPPPAECSVPSQLVFSQDEASLLASLGIDSVPVAPVPFCAEHFEETEARHRELLRVRAFRDGWTRVRDPLGGEDIFFNERTRRSLAPDELLAQYRAAAGKEDEPLVEDTDCKIPFLRGHLRPQLHPQRYELRNWYMDGVLRRHAALVRGGEDHYAYEDDRAQLEALWNKVAPTPPRACPRTRPRRARRLTRSGRGRCLTR